MNYSVTCPQLAGMNVSGAFSFSASKPRFGERQPSGKPRISGNFSDNQQKHAK